VNNIKLYVEKFFGFLDIGSDKDNLHYYKEYMATAASEFLDHETKELAYDVYSFFLDTYRINISGKRSFIDLLDVLRKYEENAAVLSDKQRDHYIHSVNVFLLGLAIYEQNESFRSIFKVYLSDKTKNIIYFDSIHEEFFFRWGMSALFHDIGYPVEIVNNQINKFIGFISGMDEKGKAEASPYLGYFNFDKINSINNFNAGLYELPEYISKFSGENGLILSKPTDDLSINISYTFKLDYIMVQKTLTDFLETMQRYGFVDHGFYSSMIMLKWYGELIQKNKNENSLLFSHILDSAVAIFLHNSYSNIFKRKPYFLEKLKPIEQPIAYLLILCDEAQEWNREAYGEKTRKLIQVDSSRVEINETEMNLHYITNKGVLNEEFVTEKEKFINDLLEINDIFKNNIKITATTLTQRFIKDLAVSRTNVFPRVLIEYIELIAINIHKKYNEKQIEKYPDKSLEYPDWESLPETLKYSNVRQAKDMVNKLDIIGCYISEKLDKVSVIEFLPSEIEDLAYFEHENWVKERLGTGWSYSKEKNTALKKSPYIKPYDELPEEIKDLDRDTVRNIIPLLGEVGLFVYRATDLN